MKGGKANASFSSSNINSTCCILNCNKPSSIRNFSCLQGIWKLKLEHAQSTNIEGLKICTTHYNEDLRQHPRVGGQGNNHHTTRKDKQRKRRLQEEKKRLLTEAVKKNGGETPQELEEELNKLSAQIDEQSDSGEDVENNSSPSSTNITPRTVRKRKSSSKKRRFKEDEAREDYSSGDDDDYSNASSTSNNSPKMPRLETVNHAEIEEETVQQQQQQQIIESNNSPQHVSNSKRKRNFVRNNEQEMMNYGNRYYELLSGVKFADFAPHISMVHNLSNNLSLKYDLTLFREMIKLFPPNKYFVHIEDNSQRYLLKLHLPESTDSTPSIDIKPNSILFSLSSLSIIEDHKSHSPLPHLNDQSTVNENSHPSTILHDNIEWKELRWGLQSLKIRDSEYELRCFQFVPIS